MNTVEWLLDLLTHGVGMFLEIFVDGLLPALFEWYFVTPYAIDFGIVHNLWLYVRLATAPFLFIGFFVSWYKFYKGQVSKGIVGSFLIALLVSGGSLYLSDYFSFLSNSITDAIRNPILIEAYKDEQSDLKIVQEGLDDEDIDMNAFSPLSILKYSFGAKLTEDEKEETTTSENDEAKADPFQLNKVKGSKGYPGIGNYKTLDPKVSQDEVDENLYEVFLIKNGGAGPLVCFAAMVEIAIMCILAVFRLIVLMLIIGIICVFITKDTFTGGNEDLKSVLKLLNRTIWISFFFNLGWLASSVLTHNEDLSIIHPQYWAIIIYGIVIGFTYLFWVKEIINNIIRPSVERVKKSVENAGSYGAAIKGYAGKVKSRFGGSGEPTSAVNKTDVNLQVQNTSTLTNNKDYLNGLSTHDRYQKDPEFFRNPEYDFKHQSTSGHFYSGGQKANFDEDLGRMVKTSR